MSGRIYFVTGTDTGVGKTVVTGWLASLLAPRCRLAVIKPAQTGSTAPAVDGDEHVYRQAAGSGAATICTLVSLPEPLAPSIAAARAGRPIDVDSLVAECLAIADEHDVTLVEGAGGLLVPLSDEVDMAGLAQRLAASLVVVLRPALGTLNHTMLTVEAAERRGLHVDALVCSGYPAQPDVVERENLRFLRDRYPGLPLIVLGEADLADEVWPARVPVALMGPEPGALAGVALPSAGADFPR